MGNDQTETVPFEAGRIAHEERVRERRRRLREELAALRAEPSEGRAPVLEIGAGHGHFLAAYAAKHPEHHCLGIDLVADRVRRGNKKRNRLGVNNLCFIQAEAMEFLQALPEGVMFERIFVLFPDPWPKKRHHKNRLLSTAFFEAMAGRASPGAELCFRTDHRPYFDEVRARVASLSDWSLAPEAVWPFEEMTVFQARADSFSSLIAIRS